ncbi:hypothetical protein Ct61P_00879 [Colletotrichum tofieldiae]|nr:hypothetical protein Ct61P_00879 [Colletotrichum tofieldiae]
MSMSRPGGGNNTKTQCPDSGVPTAMSHSKQPCIHSSSAYTRGQSASETSDDPFIASGRQRVGPLGWRAGE